MDKENPYSANLPLNLSDADAWKRFKLGNSEAFESIFKKFNPVLLHFGIRFFHDQEIVEDCIQELFLKLWTARDQLPEVTNVKYYLITALRRSLLRNWVIQKRQSDMNQMLRALDPAAEEIPSYESNIIVRQLVEQRTHSLAVAIDRLPPRQKQAVYLKFYEEKSYDEITSIMKVNYQTARKFVYKALQAIRRTMSAGDNSGN